MALQLYYHPLSSFSWKAVMAFYENGVAFTPVIVDQNTAAEFRALWPIGKFPLLVDGDCIVPESSIIIEYIDHKFPGATRLVPADPDLAWRTRLWDRFYDHYLQYQKIVGDRLRPGDNQRDAYGVEEAHKMIDMAYDVIDREMADKPWAVGDAFTLADCAASPALHYANRVHPIGARKHVAAYLARLEARPSFARVLKEAAPYAHLFPTENLPG